MADLLSSAIIESSRRISATVADSAITAHEGVGMKADVVARLYALTAAILLYSTQNTGHDTPRHKN